jgi:phosphoglucomutase
MIEIYQDLGMYYEGLVNVVRKGKSGAEEIEKMMKDFRENLPKEIAGSARKLIKDFKEQTCLDLSTNKKSVMDEIPKSNVLIYYTEDGTKVCIRPSGTEPKIKFYISVKDTVSSERDFVHKLFVLNQKIEKIKEDFN